MLCFEKLHAKCGLSGCHSKVSPDLFAASSDSPAGTRTANRFGFRNIVSTTPFDVPTEKQAAQNKIVITTDTTAFFQTTPANAETE